MCDNCTSFCRAWRPPDRSADAYIREAAVRCHHRADVGIRAPMDMFMRSLSLIGAVPPNLLPCQSKRKPVASALVMLAFGLAISQERSCSSWFNR